MLLGTLVILLMATPTMKSIVMGLPLVVAGVLIRLWSAGCLKKIEQLITVGPFALCRNPLYVGSFFVMAGYLVMANRLDVGIVGMILFWVFHGGAVAHEEKLLRGIYGDQFNEYCRRVPRFFPRVRLAEAREGFSIAQLKWNSEHKAIITSAVVVTLFVVIAYCGCPLDILGWR